MENIETLSGKGENISESEEEEKGEKRPKNSFLRQCFCLTSVMAFPFLSVTTSSLGNTSYPIITPFQGEFQVKGGVVGYIFGGIVWYLMGAKYLVVVANLMFLILAVLTVIVHDYINQHPSSLYTIHFIHTFSNLAFYVYTAEISDSSFRAFFMGLHPIITNLAHPKFDYYQKSHESSLIVVYWINFIVAIPFSLLSLLVPDTPFSIARKGNYEKARAIFEWLRAEEVDEFEYEMMIQKADSIAQRRGIASKIFSSTFTGCMIAGLILGIAQSGNCDMPKTIAHDYYFPNLNKTYTDDGRFMWDYHYYFQKESVHPYHFKLFGCLVYQGLSFYMPRKILYTFTIILDSILVVPAAIQSEYMLVIMAFPLCNVLPFAGTYQSMRLLPIEIFPAALRYIGVTVSYLTEKIAQFVRIYDGEPGKIYYQDTMLNLSRKWTYFSYCATLVGIPFILIFVPETMGKNLYELEDITKPLSDGSSLQEEGAVYITEEAEDS